MPLRDARRFPWKVDDGHRLAPRGVSALSREHSDRKRILADGMRARYRVLVGSALIFNWSDVLPAVWAMRQVQYERAQRAKRMRQVGMTYGEIGRGLGICLERARQIVVSPRFDRKPPVQRFFEETQEDFRILCGKPLPRMPNVSRERASKAKLVAATQRARWEALSRADEQSIEAFRPILFAVDSGYGVKGTAQLLDVSEEVAARLIRKARLLEQAEAKAGS